VKWRWLALAVALPALLWAGWWVVGSRLHATALEAWLGQRRADGWIAEAGSLSTAGFPNRFDTRIERLSLADPEQGWAWETPFVDILMLAWQPNAAILALPPGQTVAVPGARARLDAAPMRASVRFRPGLTMPLAQLSAEADALNLTGEAGWQAGADRLAAHLQARTEADAPPNGYRAFAEAVAVRLPPALRAIVDPAGALSPVADSLRVDARLAFDAPLDRRAVEDRMPGLRAVSIETAELRWGDLALRAAGSLTADAAGHAEGRLDVRAENWRAMLAAMVQAGLIGRDTAGALEFGLGLLSRERGGRSVIEVPLSFGSGVMRLGPVPIGTAPRLRTTEGAP
jgi:hypothetical protein